MTKRKLSNQDCVLATDFSIVDQHMKDWEDQREKKGNIYKAFSEYIICLENSLEHEDDFYERYLIEQEIKKLKKEKEKYYVPSILEIALYNERKDEKSTETLQKNSFSLVKRLRKK